jgi:putative PEP-CTERM system TPR-repeat lipoprotein
MIRRTFLFLLLVAVITPVIATDLAQQDRVEALLTHVDDLLEQGKTRTAIIELKNAAREAPNDPGIRERLGLIYFQSGKLEQAAKELKRAHDHGANGRRLITALSSVLIQTGQHEQAFVLLQSVEHPSPGLLALRGDARWKHGDIDGAKVDYDAALKLDPKLLTALLGHARLAQRKGTVQDALLWANRAVSKAPGSVAAWRLLGELETMNQRPAAALVAFEQALQRQPGSADLHLNAAVLLMTLKRPDEAAAQLDQSLALQRDNPLAQSLAAMLVLEAGRPAEARDTLQRIVIKYPGYHPALLYLGKAHLALKEYALAVAELLRFIEVEPDSMEGAVLYAQALTHTNASTKAVYLLDSLAERFPGNLEILKAQQFAAFRTRRFKQASAIDQRLKSMEQTRKQLDTAVDLLSQGETNAALTLLEQLMTSHPALYRAYLLQFRELALTRDYVAAEKVARKLAEQLPDHPLPPLLIGISLAGQGDSEAAQAEFEIAWQRAPGNPGVATRLAVLALSRGDGKAAEGYYNEVLEHHPGHAVTLKSLAALAKKRGNHEQRLTYLEQYVSYHPIELKPRLLLARELYVQGKGERAIEVLRNVDKRIARHPDYLAFLTMLQMLLNPEAAVESAHRLIEVQPESPYAHLILAEAEARLAGGPAEFQQLMQGAMVLDGSGGLSVLRIDEQRINEALALAREMNKRYPDAGIWVELEAQILLRRGDVLNATTLMDAWGRKYPDSAIPEILAAGIALAKQDQVTATSQYRKALFKAPNNVTALNNLAWLTLENNPVGALKLARHAAEVSSTAEILDTLGVVLTANDQPGRAVTILRVALARDQESTEKRLHLAQAYAAVGDKKAARQLLDAMLQSEEAFVERDQAQALLDGLGKD